MCTFYHKWILSLSGFSTTVKIIWMNDFHVQLVSFSLKSCCCFRFDSFSFSFLQSSSFLVLGHDYAAESERWFRSKDNVTILRRNESDGCSRISCSRHDVIWSYSSCISIRCEAGICFVKRDKVSSTAQD